MINFREVWRVIGFLILLVGILQIPSVALSFYLKTDDFSGFLMSLALSLGTGSVMSRLKSKSDQGIRKREGYLIVAFGWIAMCIFSMLPYLLSGYIPELSNAFFESVSGLTTTGATILPDIEIMPDGILLWRSTTHWIGGMGIIVLTVALFPLLGIGGMELFVAETPGPSSDKLHPRIKETARKLWQLYLALTIILIILYWLAGMSFLDACNHSMATISSGGFSTKNASMGFYTSPLIQYTCIFFMFLAGVNFSLIYFSLKGNVRKLLWNEEFRAYLWVIFATTVFVTIGIYRTGDYGFEESFRAGLFSIVSLITTTGFGTTDYTQWTNGLTLIFFILLFAGGCAGSTSGGIKFIRHTVFFKHTILEFKRILHPQALLSLKINKKSVSPKIVNHIMTFLLTYLLVIFTGMFVLSVAGYDLETSISAVATSLGNVGPGIGGVSPANTFAFFTPGIKVFLAVLMLIGRLELFTILVIFTPYFWKIN